VGEYFVVRSCMEMSCHFDDIWVIHFGKDMEFSVLVFTVLFYLFDSIFLVVLFVDGLSVFPITK